MRVTVVALSLALAGCSPLIGLLVRAAGSGAGAIRAGQRVSGSTTGAPSEWDPSCGATEGGSDRAYVFVPERSGVYRVDVDAGYDCVVAVFDEQRQSVACNDDTGRTTHSMVEHRLEAGRRYTIVVDGYRGATGTYTLGVEAVSLEDANANVAIAGERVLVIGTRREGDTSSASDRRTPPCGSAPGSPDDTWTFTPTETGVYDIALDSDYDGVLAVYAAGAAEPLACNDDAGSTRASRVSAPLTAGTAYEIVIDGYHGGRGRYSITIGVPVPVPPAEPLAENEGAMEARCAGAPMLSSGGTLATIAGARADARTSCGGGLGGELVYRVEAPARATLEVSAESSLEPVLELRTRCSRAHTVVMCSDGGSTPRRARLQATLEPGQTYFLVLDTRLAGDGGVTLDARIAPAP